MWTKELWKAAQRVFGNPPYLNPVEQNKTPFLPTNPPSSLEVRQGSKVQKLRNPLGPSAGASRVFVENRFSNRTAGGHTVPVRLEIRFSPTPPPPVGGSGSGVKIQGSMQVWSWACADPPEPGEKESNHSGSRRLLEGGAIQGLQGWPLA